MAGEQLPAGEGLRGGEQLRVEPCSVGGRRGVQWASEKPPPWVIFFLFFLLF